MKQLPPDRQAMIEAFRAVAREHLDRWVDQQVNLFNTEKLPTLKEISDQFTRTRSTLLGGCLEKMVDELTTVTAMRLAVPKGLNHLPDELLKDAMEELR